MSKRTYGMSVHHPRSPSDARCCIRYTSYAAIELPPSRVCTCRFSHLYRNAGTHATKRVSMSSELSSAEVSAVASLVRESDPAAPV